MNFEPKQHLSRTNDLKQELTVHGSFLYNFEKTNSKH